MLPSKRKMEGEIHKDPTPSTYYRNEKNLNEFVRKHLTVVFFFSFAFFGTFFKSSTWINTLFLKNTIL